MTPPPPPSYPPYPPAPPPPSPHPARPQSEIDEEQLGTLALGYLITGVLVMVFSCFALPHLLIGILIVSHVIPTGNGPNQMPLWMGYLFLFMGGAFVLGGWTLGIVTLNARRFLIERRHYTFLLILAGIHCVVVTPIGTVLGVFTFVLLLRPSIRALFTDPAHAPTAA